MQSMYTLGNMRTFPKSHDWRSLWQWVQGKIHSLNEDAYFHLDKPHPSLKEPQGDRNGQKLY